MPGVVAETSKSLQETKNQRRRRLERERKQQNASRASSVAPESVTDTEQTLLQPTPEPQRPLDPAEETFYTKDDSIAVDDAVNVAEDDPLFAQFKHVLEKFKEADKEDPALKEPDKPQVFFDDDDIPEEDEDAKPKMGKKKRKQLNKLSIAELKALVKKPELVDWTDTDAPDPRLLIAIKSYRNVVPVPTHWALKREYLSSKRGVEKAPFALPKFIQDTGIAEMRDSILEKQEQATLKQRQRERVAPKTGKLNIDYEKLWNAFFRFQTKPELTRYGEVYYEGKEYETNLRHLRPGDLSEELKDALGMPPNVPPPWLINQQRFGPPPSYPSLKIPGLNAPPPPGGQWGFHPGGYGKPPVDEHNAPLFGGDIFGVLQPQRNMKRGEPVERTLWGELQAQEDEEEEVEESDEEGHEEMDDEEKTSGTQTGTWTSITAGTESVAASAFGGTESVQGDFTLRKQRPGTDTEEYTGPRSAGQVLPEQNVRSSGFFGSERGYDLKAAQASRNLPVLDREQVEKKRKAGDIDVSVDVDALERDDRISKEELSKRYESQRQQQHQSEFGGGHVLDQDDLTEMIASESAKRQKQDRERRSRR